MIKGDLVQRMEQLLADRVPFVTATVVRAAKPTSVRPGDAALVLADGTIEGFVGGVCAQASVRLHAARALETGEAVLLRLLPGRAAERRPSHDGVVVAHNPCLSGGSLEIFLDPQLAAPRDRDRGRHADRPRAGRRRRARPATTSRAAARSTRSRPTPRWSSPRTATTRRRALARRAGGRRRLRRARRQPEARRARCSSRSTSTTRCARRSTRPPGLDIGARTPGRHRDLDPRPAGRRAHDARARSADRAGARRSTRSAAWRCSRASRRRTSTSAASASTSAARAAARPTPREHATAS